MENTDRLYHYTKLDTLKYILKNRTIRFSRLSDVNDKFEAETEDLGNLGKYIFVSCWSFNSKESIPMWNMYGDNFGGIRISMNFPIFKLYPNQYDSYPNLFPEKAQVTDKYFVMPTEKNKIIHQVNYTDNPEELRPKMKKTYSEFLKGLGLGDTGLKKTTYWDYENEWRFIIRTVPIPENFKLDQNILQYFNESVKLIENKAEIGINEMYLNISDEAFESMEITLGPKLTEAQRDELESLVKEFNSSVKLIESSLKDQI